MFALVPIFFSSNLVFGRGIADEVSPFLTAFIRWAGSTLLIAPFLYHDWPRVAASFRHNKALWCGIGFTNIVICGGVVYWSLTLTTASNATLIYTTSPLLIILFERLFAGRHVAGRELAGILIALVGVIIIVLRGNFGALLELSFNPGDLGMLVASVAFAIYSILLRQPAARTVAPLSLFGLVALTGSVLLLPLAIGELVYGGLLPHTGSAWSKLAGLILFASLASFIGFQHTVRVFGPAMAGTAMYLMSPASIVMAVIFLGETFQAYHAQGFVLVLGGVMLATIRPYRS